MANTWWIVVPSTSDADRNSAQTPADAIIAEVSDTSQQYSTWLNTDNGGATYQGKTYYRRMGPFTSAADAQKAFKSGAQPVASPIPGVKINPDGSVSLNNPLSGLESIARILGDLGRAVTDGKMWRSIGWILLGFIVFGFGLTLWLRKPIEQAVGTAAKAVAF